MKAGVDTQLSSSILFASSNQKKYDEARDILERSGISLEYFECELDEIQSDSLHTIALAKATDALLRCKRPVIVDDAGLYIDALGGFPGPYSAYVQKTIGNSGILKLLDTLDRHAAFMAAIAYAVPGISPRVFESSVKGTISESLCGNGWGYDPIFIPQGHNQTFAEISNKNQISHRARALEMFAAWFNSTPQSSD